MQNKILFAGVLKYLAKRARSKKEIIDWLNKKGATSEIENEILQKLTSLKLIDDLSYAESFIRTRMLLKPRSIRVLKLELTQKGISKEIFEEALDLNKVDEEVEAKKLIEKNIWRWKKFDEKTTNQKIREFLMRKGFGFNVIKKLE